MKYLALDILASIIVSVNYYNCYLRLPNVNWFLVLNISMLHNVVDIDSSITLCIS